MLGPWPMNLAFAMAVMRSGKSKLTLVGQRASWLLGRMDTGSKSELFENANRVPIDINLIPPQPVSGRNRVGMMVVMPPISET